ncbi:MAG TPA: energy transducer TonB [Holophaga sp.]|nr:energy transducer TonB [Holophaga sp.]
MTISKALPCLTLAAACAAQAPMPVVPWSSLRLIRRPADPAYPILPIMGRIAGNVRVQFELTDKGRVLWARAQDGPRALRTAAEHFIQECGFEPAREGEKAIPVRSEVEVPFRLDGSQATEPEAPLTGYVLRIRSAALPGPEVDLARAEGEARAMLARVGLKPVAEDKADPARTLDLSLDLQLQDLGGGSLLANLRARISTLADRDLPETPQGEPPRVWRFHRLGALKATAATAATAFFGRFLPLLEDRLQPAPTVLPVELPSSGGKPVVFDFTQMRIKVQPPAPPYPPLARLARIQGTVLVEMIVDPEGIPVSAVALSGPPQLAVTAVRYAMDWRFEPAKLDGIPQTARFRLTMPFNLR